jgi:hypothetical protein
VTRVREGPVVVPVAVERPPGERELEAAVRPLQPPDQLLLDAGEVEVLVRRGGDRDPVLRAFVDAGGRRRVGAVGVRAVHEATGAIGEDDAERAGLHRVQRGGGDDGTGAVATTMATAVPARGFGRRGSGWLMAGVFGVLVRLRGTAGRDTEGCDAGRGHEQDA